MGFVGVRSENEFPITAVNIPHPSAVAIHTRVWGAVFVTTDGAPVSGRDGLGTFINEVVGAPTREVIAGGGGGHCRRWGDS